MNRIIIYTIFFLSPFLIAGCITIDTKKIQEEYFFELGNYYYKNQTYNLAIACFSRVIEANPQNADAYYLGFRMRYV